MQDVQQSMASSKSDQNKDYELFTICNQTLKDNDRSREELGAIMHNRKGSTQPQVSIYDTHHCTNKNWKKNAFGWWRNHIHCCSLSVPASTYNRTKQLALNNYLPDIIQKHFSFSAFILIFHLFLCAKLS